MDNLDDSETNAKISDSAYSNSCSNSQSRRSHSSKSTHSGSNSSGSSGYGGKPSASGYSNNLGQQPEKRTKDKEAKKKKKVKIETNLTETKKENEWPPAPVFESPKEDIKDVARTPPTSTVQVEKGPESMEIMSPERSCGKDESSSCNIPIPVSVHVTSRRNSVHSSDGFSCVISMQDGVVMYTASSITTALGFPKDMWVGRSFIDFVHPRDRSTFASQITRGLAVPKNVNGTQAKAPVLGNHVCSMVCRIRRYRGLSSGFGVKDRMVTFMPFMLKFYFKNINDEEGHVIYLVIQATPFFSAFKSPNEVISNAVPFVIRHSSSGSLEYIDPESVPYLGYLPQDIMEKDALQLYHPADLVYLRQVYETIVKEGVVSRTKPYRMMAQNGHYLKLETEWSSFINPWSKKLEFVIGKHFITEGPLNPDVFQSPEPENNLKLSDEEKNMAQTLRQNITRIMNEALTKPAEAAKQQMSQRCQDLASFMETLMEDTPKGDEELRLEIHDPDHSCYERDSVMLGGISPHHDYNDSKSSTETPISYNQLNYNETLQRYFDSHEPFEEYTVPLTDTKMDMKKPGGASSNFLSSMGCSSGDYVEGTSMSDSSAVVLASCSQISMDDYHQVRLTESLLSKHNVEMEKELVKMHRENRSSNKGDRDKSSNETRQKKKEHLARCNAFYQSPTAAVSTLESQPHGIKRASKQSEETSGHKHRCSPPRLRKRQSPNSVNVSQPTTVSPTVSSPWAGTSANGMNTFILGLGIPQQMSIMSPMHMPGMFPMYYSPAVTRPVPTTEASSGNVNTTQFQGFAHPVNSSANGGQFPHPSEGGAMFCINSPSTSATSTPAVTNSANMHYQSQHPMPCMMFGQAVYGSPFMYSSVNPQVYAMQQNFVNPNMQNFQPLGLSGRNYEEACKLTLPLKAGKWFTTNIRREKTAESQTNVQDGINTCDVRHSSVGTSNRSSSDGRDLQGLVRNFTSEMRDSFNHVQCTERPVQDQLKRKSHRGNSDGTIEKTDEESSYSSFYSSFFKTESGSTEESDVRNTNREDGMLWQKKRRMGDTTLMSNIDTGNTNDPHPMKVTRMEQVCLTSELIYKYQILTKNMEEVLIRDKEKLQTLEQPSMVNEQLGQLYLDLQLEGVAARLTLEEGITSSSSSGEETPAKSSKQIRRRKREYSKLVMIYEEDAPLPPPEDTASSSRS